MEVLSSKGFEKDLTTLAVLISLNNKSFGSGMFLLYDSGIYFVSARHVLFHKKTNPAARSMTFRLKTDIIDLFFYPKGSDFKTQEQLRISVKTLVDSQNFTAQSNQDICVFKIADIVAENMKLIPGVEKISKTLNINVAAQSMVKNFDQISVGDNLYVIGYPKALGLKNNHQFNFNQPLVRNGIIAGKNQDQKTLIIDCPVYGGNSGGPVFITEQIIESTKSKLRFLNKKYLAGIVTEFIPWINQTNKENPHMENSGYGVIVSFDEIIRLIQSLPK